MSSRCGVEDERIIGPILSQVNDFRDSHDLVQAGWGQVHEAFDHALVEGG